MFVEDTKSSHYRPLCDAKTFRAVCKVFDMENELDAWIKEQQEHGWPTDLDTVPRKTATAKEVAAATKTKAASETSKKNAVMVVAETESTLGKRKQDDLKDEVSVSTTVVEANGTNAQAKEVEGAPAAKKHAGDGSSSQPTPADTPQPAELDAELVEAPLA